MKKLIALLLALVMVLALVACGTKAAPETEQDVNVETEAVSPLALLESVWALYGEDEKFAIMGGNPEAGIMDAPGSWDLAQKEGLIYSLLIPGEDMQNVTEAATMIHMMNANTFTGGAVKLAEGTDTAAFAANVRDAIADNQWICGFPEKLLIAEAGGCVVIAFGVEQAMTSLTNHLAEAAADAVVLYDEPIVG